MKKFLLALAAALLLTTNCFAQCEVTIDGHQYCTFGVTSYEGITDTPALSAVGTGTMYFDAGASKFRCSEDGGAYADCVGGGGAGSGTVTNVGVATENGISGSVANPTTTPVITLSLGAIAPTSVNGVIFSGASTPTLSVTGTSSISGANTGDQTITLSGAVTGTGTGAITTVMNSALDSLTDVSAPTPTAGDSLVWSGTAWIPTAATSTVGSANNFYLDATATLADNLTLSTSPSTYPETINTKTVLVATSPVFFERFVSGPLGRTSIPAGTWNFNNYAAVDSNSGTNNRIQYRINKRVEKVALRGSFTGAGATRTWTMTSYAITAVDTGLKKFTIAGDHQFDVTGGTIVVTGSTGNNGTYTLAQDAVFTGSETEITVNEAVPSAVADGVLRAAPFVAGDANASRLLAGLIETPNQTGWITTFTNAYTVTVTLTDAGYINETDVALNAIYYYLFNDQSGDMNGASPTLYSESSVQPAFTGINLTDRLVLAMFGTSDSDTGTDTFRLYYGGSQHYTNLTSPLTTLHNDLAGLNDGEYKHLTTSEYANVPRLSIASGKVFTSSNTITLTGTDSVSMDVSNSKLGGACFHFGDGTNVITTGEKKSVRRQMKKGGTINGWTILSLDDTSGSIALDVWKDTYANYPPTVADTITASAKPSVTTTTKNTSTTLTGWTTTFSAGDVLSVNVDSVTSFKDIELCLDVTFN